MCLRRMAAIMAMVIFACPAGAQELSVLGGDMQDRETNDRSYAWQLEYKAGLGEHGAYSLTYLNEGHVPKHHRDGHAAQLWMRINVFDRRLSLGAGYGPFYYFDTLEAPAGTRHFNDHGWGSLFSLAATWHGEGRWLFHLRSNIVETGTSIDTASAVMGIGYQLDEPSLPGPLRRPEPRMRRVSDSEITIFAGRTIVNSFDSEPAEALSLEYRKGLLRHVDWTLTWLYEGKNSVMDRNGLMTQLWAVEAFFEDRFTMGAGGGLYRGIDRRRDPNATSRHDNFLIGIVTLTGGYRLNEDWGIRVSWHRTVTDYDRDTDVILSGISYRL